MLSYNLAMLVRALCCGRYACANVRAQVRGITHGWEGTPVGVYGPRQMQAGVCNCSHIILGKKSMGWAAAHVFRTPWVSSPDNTLGLPNHETCLASLMFTCPALSDGPVPIRNMGGGDSGGRNYIKIGGNGTTHAPHGTVAIAKHAQDFTQEELSAVYYAE